MYLLTGISRLMRLLMSDYESIYHKHLDNYLNEVLPECLDIVRGFVPIDTGQLQAAIDIYRENNHGGIRVNNVTLDYSEKAERIAGNAPFDVNESMEALVLANILEVGVGQFKNGQRPLFRRKKNTHAEAREATKNWWTDACEMVEELAFSRVSPHIQAMQREWIREAFILKGWKEV